MRYYYTDHLNRPTGPVEDTALYHAYRTGALPTPVLVAPEGREEWKPLEDVLPYFFSYRGGVQGPLTLYQIHAFAAGVPEPVLATEPGGDNWQPLTHFPGFSVPSPPPLPPPLPPAPTAAAGLARGRPAAGGGKPARSRRRAEFPAGVRTAGWIWILYGVMRLVVAASVVLKAAALQPASPGTGMLVFSAFGAGLPLAIGIAFLAIGVRTIRGDMPDVRSNAIGSIGIAIVTTAALYVILAPDWGTGFLIDAVLNSLLILAGLLALGDRNRFLVWKGSS